MAAPVLVCLDEVPPAPDGVCTTTAWVEVPTQVFPELSIADATALSNMALLAWVTVAAALLVRKAA